MKIASFWFCLILMAIGADRLNGDDLPSSSMPADRVKGDAQATHAAYTRAILAGKEKPGAEIPPAYWSEGIKQLKPLKVYTHRVNIVVVQHVTESTEEGKYIYIPISSYLPHSGDDGFVFSPNPRTGDKYTLGNGIFDFKRTRPPEQISQPKGTANIADRLIASAHRALPQVSTNEIARALDHGVWNSNQTAVAIAIAKPKASLLCVFLRQTGGDYLAADVSDIEGKNIGVIGPDRHYDRRETTPVKWWHRDDGLFEIQMRTQAWSSGRRYTMSGRVVIKPDGTCLWQ
jgi:hypothetical protein